MTARGHTCRSLGAAQRDLAQRDLAQRDRAPRSLARCSPARCSAPTLALAALVGAALACSNERGATARADTLSDAAAAESAKVFARMSQARSTYVTLAATGSLVYDDTLAQHATCTYDDNGAEQLIQVEGLGRDAQVSFSVMNPEEGEVPVSNSASAGRARIANLDVTIRTRHFTDGSGRATIVDPLGRSGSLTAQRFVATSRAQRGAKLAVTITWECE